MLLPTALALFLLAGAQAQPSIAPTAPPAAPPPSEGYMAGHEIDTLPILPPAPKDGSLAEQRDFEVFLATRALAGSPRWNLAAVDAVDYFHGFDCVLGFDISAANLPRTYALLRRVGVDAKMVTDHSKDAIKRPRPLFGNNQPICTEDQRAGLLKSASYPSGHTTLGWAAGLILAELAPDRAQDILIRARGFGESRVVCGVHFVSDVEAGRVNGAALLGALHGDEGFRRDLEAARAEMAAYRATHETAPSDQCAAETALASKTPW